MIGEASGATSTMPAHAAHHLQPRENREQLERGGHLRLDDVEGAPLGIGVESVDPGAHDQFALVRLADIDVHGVRHHDAVEHRLYRLGHQRLQRVALQRQPHPGHRRQHRGMPGGADRDLVGDDRAARRLDLADAAARGADRGHLAILDNVDAQRVGGARDSPRRPRRAAPPRRAAARSRRAPGNARRGRC